MRKVLVTDIDGTLIYYDERDKQNSEAIRKFRKDKNLVIACTGRSLQSVAELEEENYIKFDYYILLNGAMIADADKKIVYHKKIEKSCVNEIINMLKDERLNISINNGFEYYIVFGDGENMYRVPERLSISQVEKEDVSAILVHYKKLDGRYEELLDGLVDKINNQYGHQVVAYRNNKYVDIVPVSCSKGGAVNKIETQLNICEKEIYTIGDSNNDISMINNKYKSFTFNSSSLEIKSKADYLINDFMECISIISEKVK